MIDEPARRLARLAAVILSLFLTLAGAAAQQRPAPPEGASPSPPVRLLRIGYVELLEDERYDEETAYARIQLRPLGRPFVGAEVALGEAKFLESVLKVRFELVRSQGADVDALTAAVEGWIAEGVGFVIADLPAAALLELSARLAERPVLLLNASAPESDLRGANCRANVAHTLPSHDMQAEAMAQYLVAKRWDDILVLQGPLPGDRLLAEAIVAAARKYGARIVDIRPFVLSTDPRQREQNNIVLMTAGADHDVVYVADSDGEFGRYVPYQTSLPRPVVGSTGLVAEIWHWSWERHGAPQLNSRFEKAAGRRMTGIDWASWIAVKAVVQSVLRTKSTEYAALRDYLLGDKMNLDGFKGNPLSFRSWDRQLRQPLLLTTANAVIERAPIRGFLHRLNDLDTLGPDQPESLCLS